MSIAFDAVDQIGTYAWRYEWTATTGPYRVYANGILRQTIDDTFSVIEESGATVRAPTLEVLDANDTSVAVQIANASRALLQWRGDILAHDYLIEENDGGWTERGTLPEDGSGYYHFRTSKLAEATTAEWRVSSRDRWANASTPLTFDVFVASMPDAPAVTFTYAQGTGLVTVAAE